MGQVQASGWAWKGGIVGIPSAAWPARRLACVLSVQEAGGRLAPEGAAVQQSGGQLAARFRGAARHAGDARCSLAVPARLPCRRRPLPHLPAAVCRVAVCKSKQRDASIAAIRAGQKEIMIVSYNMLL